MSIYVKILLLFVLQTVAVSICARQLELGGLAFSTIEKKNRLVFDVTEPIKHRVYVINKPHRLVIDIKNAKLTKPINQPSAINPLFFHVTTLKVNDIDLRVLIDLKVAVNSNEFTLKSHNVTNHLVVELNSKSATKSKITSELIVGNGQNTSSVKVIEDPHLPIKINQLNPFVIAIDSGHGGNDPGARGVGGTEEKSVTFQISKKLETLVNAQKGMRAVMVRTGDYYVGLRERMKIARAANADLFVSIHADAVQDTLIKGASVYTLSTNGASSEAARWLADSENASDMVGVSLQDKEDDLVSTLFDLKQKDTREESILVANHVLKSFINISPLHKYTVQKAGFMVLKSPDIPSILVETAFISNPIEEQNLLSQGFQTKIAKAIFKGLLAYFEEINRGNNRLASVDGK